MTASQFVKKIIIVLLPVLLIGIFGQALWQYNIACTDREENIATFLKGVVANNAALIDGSKFEMIQKGTDFDSENYKEISTLLDKIQKSYQLTISEIKTLRRKENITLYVITAGQQNNIGKEFDLWLEMNPVFNTGSVEIKETYTQDDKTYLSAFAPIKKVNGDIVGLMQIDKDISHLYPDLFSFMLLPTLLGIAGILIVFAVLKIASKPLQNSVDSIAGYLKSIGSGDLSTRYQATNDDYLIEIVEVLGKLQSGIQKQVETEEDKDKLQKQIKELLRIVTAAAEGDFTVTAHVTADTLGALSDSFNLMVTDLSELIQDVKKSAEQVAQSTSGILGTTAEMASGAENQAREIEHTRNLARNVKSLANNTNISARQASESAKTAKQVAESGGDIVKKSIEGMHRIKETVHETSQHVKRLGANSTRIGEITEIISDISGRTNLLALNATIEAARAGDSGRGFTVVADEVRNLAERSSRAASEITKLINDIQSGISEVIIAMESGNKEVVEGTEMVDKAGSALREIISTVENSSTSVEDITHAVEKQLKSTEDIVEVIEKIAEIAQQTAEGAKKSEIEIKSLDSLSESLNGAVSKFKLSQL
jgi:twitching motility protein PilJ